MRKSRTTKSWHFGVDCEIDRIYKAEELKHRNSFQKIIDENKAIMRKYEDNFASERVKYLVKKLPTCILFVGMGFATLGWWVSFIIQFALVSVEALSQRFLGWQFYKGFGEFCTLNYWISASIFMLVIFIYFWHNDETEMPEPQLIPESVPPDRKKIEDDVLTEAGKQISMVTAYKKRILEEYILVASDIHEVDKMEGVEFEHFLADVFRRKGYKVQLTPASGDDGVDLIIMKAGRKIAVQCKRYSGTVGNSAVQEVFAGKSFYDCDEAMVVTNSTLTAPAVNTARKLGVTLWERSRLIEELAQTQASIEFEDYLERYYA
ncbi:restriction endonuclease [Paenibacillus sp. 7124]|uniref:Restriction endonuclease n=1 Tax=Paenibacillus apii TaxID=1850370 RepID=A0A6M1PL92_9BACL|nr:restriction endonuclease [Paenibacillus apii]NGM83254.1 restriction endonuclease [Paenibacillus apii]NJJ38901.1 restriction endonuclease [Paenibacillus apii]